MSSRSRLAVLATCVAALAAGACSDPAPISYSIAVTFPDEPARLQTRRLRVAVLVGGAGATCAAVLAGTASPGDPGYVIEDEVSFALGEAAGALEVAGEGPRLFTAEATNTAGEVFLRGCTAADAGAGGSTSVTIALQHVPPPAGCGTDADCADDGAFCTGPPRCEQGQCQASEPPDCSDGDPCTDDLCDEELDACANPALAAPPAAEGPPGDASCAGGADEDCDGLADLADPGCRTCATDADCEDGDDCTATACEAGACVQTPLEGDPCDDGLFCTEGDACRAGRCEGTAPRACDDSDPCTADRCDEAADACAADPGPPPGTEGPAGAPSCRDGTDDDCDGLTDLADPDCRTCLADTDCDDGVPCTTGTCDPGSGTCVQTPNAGGCPRFRIGPAPDTCPHGDGDPGASCDFTGETGLRDAAAAAPPEGAELLLYPDPLGPYARYLGCVDLPGQTYLGAAPGVDPRTTIVVCDGDPLQGAIRLRGDGAHVRRIGIVVQAGGVTAVLAWAEGYSPAGATSGHLVEEVWAMAVQPELRGYNQIQSPFRIGTDTTVRNSHFSGYFETDFDFRQAHRSRVVQNTFAFFQELGPIAVDGAGGLLFANNVLLSLSETDPVLFEASAATTGLVVTGNVLEGVGSAAAGYAAGGGNAISGNLLGEAPLESPLVPLFLADAVPAVAPTIPPEGTSLDGVVLDGAAAALPGAYQLRSSRSGPRRPIVRMGDGTCGANPCDVDASTPNELQVALWTAWPGSTVEVYPSAGTYAGNGILGWPVTLRGMGAVPEDVVLVSRDEDVFLDDFDLWVRHGAILSVIQGPRAGVTVENLTLRTESGHETDDHAVRTDGQGASAPTGQHVLRRLRVETAIPGLRRVPLVLGDRVLVQDVLVAGTFAGCVSYGEVNDAWDPAAPTTGQVVNSTCRLTGTGSAAPSSGFDVPLATGSLFVNVLLDLAEPAPVFRARRRSSGDTGAIALDAPVSFTAHSLAVRGEGALFDGFDAGTGSYTFSDMDSLSPGAPLFVGPQDSRLVAGAAPIDAGVDPSAVDPALSPGTSLDGVGRAGRLVDRGCYEQGL